MKVTVEPEIEQTPPLKFASTENVTGRPEVAVAVRVYAGELSPAGLGGDEVKVIVCDPRRTVKVCWARGAAACVASPGWSASIVQVPAWTIVTVEPEMVQAPALLAS